MSFVIPTTPPVPPKNDIDPTNPQHQIATFLGILAGDNYIQQAVSQSTAHGQAISPVVPPTQLGTPDTSTTQDAVANSAPPLTVQNQPDSHTPAGYGGDNLHSGSWAHDLLSMLNLPVTYENVRALTAWQRAEGGGSDGPSHSNFNWLNTTRGAPGATSINKVGVKSYASYHDGLVATAGALTNGLYGDVLSALAQGTSAQAVGRAVAASKWGTGAGLLHVLGSA